MKMDILSTTLLLCYSEHETIAKFAWDWGLKSMQQTL